MKIKITQYEFYAMAVNSLLTKAPWEAEERLSAYHESFLDEQRLLSLTMLFLLGEEFVPESALRTMPPKFSDQIRNSVNQAVFLRALKHHFRARQNADAIALKAIERMGSYVAAIREADQHHDDPLEAITHTLATRVPPHNEEEEERYYRRVQKIFRYTEDLVHKSLAEKYIITDK